MAFFVGGSSVTQAKIPGRQGRLPITVRRAVEGAAKGPYQRQFLRGKGRVGRYGHRYSVSLDGLLTRIQERLPEGWKADLPLVRLPGERTWRRELVVFDDRGRGRVWLTP
jgi:hypothetical protein